MMKALVANRYGSPEDLSVAEIAIPEPKAGQVQVRIAAASLNPTDIVAVSGAFDSLVQLQFPYILGNDFAGTITEVGDGVTEYRVGDEVFGTAMPRQLAFVASPTRPSLSTGALAEYAVFEADTPLITHRPENVSAEQAAALAIAGSAALKASRTGNVQPGEKVLVIGATGGVGTILLPLLASTGAEIVATARTAASTDALRALGADEIVGFDSADYPADLDAIINLALPSHQLANAASHLRAGGRLVSIIWPAPTLQDLGREDVTLSFEMDMDGATGGMRDVADLASQGLLTAKVSATYTLNDAVKAATRFARGGNLGKIVVTMPDIPGGSEGIGE
jgi:NADPH:quinone reductase-like Zn-dependent oxidoreductase